MMCKYCGHELRQSCTNVHCPDYKEAGVEEVEKYEDQMFYPAMLRTGIDDIEVVFMYSSRFGYFHIGGVSSQRDDLTFYSLNDFSWIGEKINIDWTR